MTELGRYRVLEELGRGGMGVVYRAADPRAEREVVIKLIQGSLDPHARERFAREARSAGRLRHPTLVRVHELGEDDRGRPYLVLGLIRGRPLKAWLAERGPFAIPEAARIVRRLAEGLEHAHQHQVLHRDVKPDNVLLDALGGEPVLTDFGLALLVDRETRLTGTGEVLGTPVYMAPEQADGDRSRIGPASDVYGLGALLYTLIGGEPPFRGGSLMAILTAVLTKPPAPLQQLRPEVDPALAAIVARCLAKEPEGRFASAGALAEALDAWGRGEAPAPPRVGRRIAAGVAGVAALGALAGLGLRARPAPESAATAEATASSTPSAAGTPAVGPQTLVLQPGLLEGRDAYVYEGQADRNLGGNVRLDVGWRRSKVGAELRSYLWFDVTSRLPADAVLRSAQLELTPVVRRRPGTPGPLPLQVRPVLEPWVEGSSSKDGISWARQPRLGDPSLGGRAVGEVGSRSPLAVDVTTLVRRWTQGLANHGLCLLPDPAARPPETRLLYYHSADARRPERRPRLVVRYHGSPPRPPWAPLAVRQRVALARAAEHLRAAVQLSDRARVDQLVTAARVAPFWAEPVVLRARWVFRSKRFGSERSHIAFTMCVQAVAKEVPAWDPLAHCELALNALLASRLPGAANLRPVLELFERLTPRPEQQARYQILQRRVRNEERLRRERRR